MVAARAGALEFTRLDEGLPFNYGIFYALNYRFVPVPNELNRYLLCVKNLPKGSYEVSADVYRQLTGTDPGKPTTVDLRSLIADHAHARGVSRITTSSSCTRCNNDRFYSHRAGDVGRQLGVIIADR